MSIYAYIWSCPDSDRDDLNIFQVSSPTAVTVGPHHENSLYN